MQEIKVASFLRSQKWAEYTEHNLEEAAKQQRW